MEKDLARHIIRTAFRTGRDLEELLQILKRHTSGEEYKMYVAKIAAAMDAVNTALVNPTLASHPDLTEEIEASLRKYDRFI